LIVGYNTLGNRYNISNRTGSHNLILGDYNNYSSYDGVVRPSRFQRREHSIQCRPGRRPLPLLPASFRARNLQKRWRLFPSLEAGTQTDSIEGGIHVRLLFLFAAPSGTPRLLPPFFAAPLRV
jgi:hypothetical protein